VTYTITARRRIAERRRRAIIDLGVMLGAIGLLLASASILMQSADSAERVAPIIHCFPDECVVYRWLYRPTEQAI